LDQLGESLTLLEQLQTDLSKIEARFPPLHQQFAILEKYEVTVSPEVQSSIKYFVLLFIFCSESRHVNMNVFGEGKGLIVVAKWDG
jgi:hypothetical protein